MELALILLSSSSFFAVIRMSVSGMVQLPFWYSRTFKGDEARVEEGWWWWMRDVAAAVCGGSDMALASLSKKNGVLLEVISK